MSRQVINNGTSLNDPSAETLYSAFTKVNSMTAELYLATGHSVLGYGATGDSDFYTPRTDDTAGIQAAVNAAVASGGTAKVLFPGNRTYRITSTIQLPFGGIHLIGLGTRGSSGTADLAPAIIWGGAAGGTMFQVAANPSNSMGVYFENLTLVGKFAGVAESGAAGKGIYYANTLPVDSGTGFRDCWFNAFNGNAIHFTAAGSTNFLIDGYTRFDAIFGGYGIYCDLKTNGHFIGVIQGNPNYVGGGSVQGNGFIFMDGESIASGTGTSHIVISGLHTEINQNLNQTFAAGTNPYDRRGIIRYGVTPANNQTEHILLVNGWTNSSAGVNSYSAIQITAASGTDADAAAGVYAHINGAQVLSDGADDTAATGQIRMFGGKVPSRMRYTPAACYRHGTIAWGEGKNFTGEHIGSMFYQRPGSLVVRGLAFKPETYAEANDSGPFSAGAEAYITDCNSTTIGGTAAGGGSHKAKILWNGTAWKITAIVD